MFSRDGLIFFYLGKKSNLLIITDNFEKLLVYHYSYRCFYQEDVIISCFPVIACNIQNFLELQFFIEGDCMNFYSYYIRIALISCVYPWYSLKAGVRSSSCGGLRKIFSWTFFLNWLDFPKFVILRGIYWVFHNQVFVCFLLCLISSFS